MSLRLLPPFQPPTTHTAADPSSPPPTAATYGGLVISSQTHYRVDATGRHAIADDGRVVPVYRWGVARMAPGSEVWMGGP